jgi:alpha-galactosidase
MNRNYFVSDPDAFSISRHSSAAQGDHGGPKTLTLSEAQVAIALAAVSGGMYEIGDDLPTLFLDRDRMALLENRDLLNIPKLGRASTPLDLMSYSPEDQMPSTFLLRESQRQSILTVFNWTAKERTREFKFSALGLSRQYAVSSVFGSGAAIGGEPATLSLKLSPHSVTMLKMVDTTMAPSAPSLNIHPAEKIETGKPAMFSAESSAEGVPAISCRWDFGDGTSAEGMSVTHSYTHAGNFALHLTAEGIEGVPFEKTFQVTVSGKIDTVFRPELYERYGEQH